MDKKKFSTFSYKLVQISPIMILVNSGACLSISSWFSELTELIFCHDTIHFFYWLPPNNARDYGSCGSSEFNEMASFKETRHFTLSTFMRPLCVLHFLDDPPNLDLPLRTACNSNHKTQLQPVTAIGHFTVVCLVTWP